MALGRSDRENRARAAGRSCAHCASPIPDGAASPLYCCAGCEGVAALLEAEHLGRYYELAAGAIAPVGAPPVARGHAWLEPILAGRDDADTQACELDVQGIHCAACVWLLNETFRRRPGGVSVVVNPALGKVRLTWRRGLFDVAGWVTAVERFGYQFGPSRKTPSPESAGAIWRLGVSAALAMNVMLFSVSFYFGLSRADGETYRLFTWLALLLSTGVVAVGGWPFFRSAAAALRSGILHLDLPIALGIALVYATSVAELARGRGGEMAYFDSLNVFITLMLLGRFLQQRVIDRNRQLLLADEGADGVYVRRLEADDRPGVRLEVVRAPSLREGDRLLIAPGELVPVDARLLDARARLSTDWITGEAAARDVTAGAVLPAGGFNAGDAAFTIVALQPFADSPLVALLRQTSSRAGTARHLRFWDRLARRWVASVLAVAGAGFALWWPRGAGRALDVAVALLVVSCPCAIGIALPLAYEIVQARLRRAGFFVRAGDLLDRLVRVRKIVFDKTGTLTLQRLELSADGTGPLTEALRDVGYNLACRSAHPVAACVAASLARAGAAYEPAAAVVEIPGAGLEWRRPDGTWRLGRAGWAAEGDLQAGTVLARDGVAVARFATREMMRTGAASDLAALGQAGYQVHVVSGDTPARVAAMAARLGVAPERAHGGRGPADKAGDLAALGGDDALFLGDGANDALAFGRALCAGTVAIDRPVLPGRSDFFIVGESLRPLREALAAAQKLRRVARQVLAISLAYNVVALGTALGGHMSPVRAAIFMPLSSLSILLFTAAALRPGVRQRPATFAPLAEAAR